MNKRAIILVILAILLGGWWVYAYSGLFASPAIEMIYQLQPPRNRNANAKVFPVSFGLNREVMPTTIRVWEVDPGTGDVIEPPVWNMVYNPEAHEKARVRAEAELTQNPNARPRSLATRAFVYGRRIPGLKRADPEIRPQPLQPGVTYRLRLEAEEGDAEIDFQTRAIETR